MVNNNPKRVASPQGAASAYAKAAPQGQVTSMAEAKSAPRRLAGGFWLGFVLVAVALSLMLGKTVLDYLTTANTPTQAAANTASFARAQTHLDTWRSEEAEYAEDLPIFPHNPTTGNTQGPKVVTFIDLGCVPCRAELQRLSVLRQEYAARAQFVVKLLPDHERPMSSEAAVFALVAQDHNKFWPFHDAVTATTQDGVAYYLSVLEGLGISLRDLRQAMARHQEDYLRALNQDTALAQTLNLATPTTVFIESHRLGSPGLPRTEAEAILMRAIVGQPLMALE